MEILSLHNETFESALAAGEKRHLVLADPQDACLHVVQHAGSELVVHCVKLTGGGHCGITVEHEGEGCRTQLNAMALVAGNDFFSLDTHIRHNKGGGYSDQLVKFLVGEHGRGSFYGEMVIAPDAQRTEAHQTNRNILLSPTARMDTKPQLEIYADDVKASHGATTGQLDSLALFYMQQRGIPYDEARRMLLTAFIADVLDGLDDGMREELLRKAGETGLFSK